MIDYDKRRGWLREITFTVLGSTVPIIREAVPWVNTPMSWDKLGYFLGAWICGGMTYFLIAIVWIFLDSYLAKILWGTSSKERNIVSDETMYNHYLFILAICVLYWAFQLPI